MPKLLLINLLFWGMIFISCRKVPVVNNVSTAIENPVPSPPSPLNSVYTTPNVSAGSDIYIVFPGDSCTLNGSVQFPEHIETVLWNKITGQGSLVIENPGSYKTKLRNLEKGIYIFELTVTNKAGLSGKDTVSVFVLEEGSYENEIVFKDLQWGCPMGCHIRIENFHSYIPIGTAFNVYLKRDHSTEWVKVVNMSEKFDKYMWTIYNNGLEILEDQTEFPNDSPDVKIIF